MIKILGGNSAAQLATQLAADCILSRHTRVLVFFPVLHLFTEKYLLYIHVAVTARAVGHLVGACPFSRNTFFVHCSYSLKSGNNAI